MSDAIVRFRSPRQPAHYVRAGRGYKFVGGRLAVAPSRRRGGPRLRRWPTRRSGSSRSRARRASRKPQPPEAEA